MTDPVAERIRKVGGSTLKSIGHVSRTQRLLDNDEDYVHPPDMLAELRDDNKILAAQPAPGQSSGWCYGTLSCRSSKNINLRARPLLELSRSGRRASRP